ncbi:acyltransferase [Flavobacterium sp. IB48]|uniref:acyltransferase family protein n=1 Tax=Flavobacterium sp. IB48 TaxID=2779375 RepID=UPI0018E72A35|nr:acyltransferase [Flavobacterium sp. IB48]MBJ2123584.1 acyltransferase [Flavobacterium sp. IB48]
MNSQTSEKFLGLDHLRSLAILMVLLYHYRMFQHPDWVDKYGQFGWTGVDLFFVLSGFLISKQLFEQLKFSSNIRFKEFYIKRFFRIIPAYALTLFLYFTFPFFREKEALPPFWKFITFTQNIGLDLLHFGTFSHAWSLCIEEQFYLIFPIILLLFLKFKKVSYIKYFLLFLLLFTLSLRIISWQLLIVPNLNSSDLWRIWYMKIYYPTYTRLDGLTIGIGIAFFYEYSKRFKNLVNSYGNQLFLIGLIIVGFSFWICSNQISQLASTVGFTTVSIGYGLIVMSAISKSCFLYHSKSILSTQLASLSFSIYLTHKGIIHLTQIVLQKLNIDNEGQIALLICFINCIIISLFIKYLVEKPSSKIKNYVLKIKS